MVHKYEDHVPGYTNHNAVSRQISLSCKLETQNIIPQLYQVIHVDW